MNIVNLWLLYSSLDQEIKYVPKAGRLSGVNTVLLTPEVVIGTADGNEIVSQYMDAI